MTVAASGGGGAGGVGSATPPGLSGSRGCGKRLLAHPNWKQLLLPEIPATRFSCLTSGSLRPKLGLCILSVVLIVALCLLVVPLVESPLHRRADNAMIEARQSRALVHRLEVDHVARANRAFHARLYPVLVQAQGTNRNLVISPFSASSVLALALAGARGDTARQLETALGLDREKEKEADDANAIHRGFGDVMRVMRSDENFTLDVANRLFLQDKLPVQEDYLTLARAHYSAEPARLDFGQSESARRNINTWVEQQTHERIKDLLAPGSVNALTKVVLVNAVYFKGNWAAQFNPKQTRREPFTVSPEETVQVDMMHRSGDYRGTYSPELKASVLELPYKGDRLSMLLVLPKRPDDFAQVEKRLTSDWELLDRLDFGRKIKFDVSVPRFRVESTHELVAPLQSLGIRDLFEPDKADLSGLSGAKGDLHVSSVVQKAFLQVNEEGSEAAAATGMVMMARMAVLNERFVCNRPFLFAIKDKLTGLVVFSGRVVRPEQTQGKDGR